ncbi:hypothetical protein FACS1894166_06660 [Bacilli bacterium]|nr:hypothetical protein FACS1894166_06660 [Bacilli bacterium]
MPTRTKLRTRFQEIIKNLELYMQDINEQVKSADIINQKSIQSGSPSLRKVAESNLYRIDELLLKCNMYAYIIDEASEDIRKILGLASKEFN